MLAENAKNVEISAEIYRNGGREIITQYASIDEYLATKIQSLPGEWTNLGRAMQVRSLFLACR